jgi:hypothetical protein
VRLVRSFLREERADVLAQPLSHDDGEPTARRDVQAGTSSVDGRLCVAILERDGALTGNDLHTLSGVSAEEVPGVSGRSDVS